MSIAERALEGENHAVLRGGGPLVLTCEHAGREVPPALGGLGLDDAFLDTHWGWDRWARDATLRLAAALDATAVTSRLSRLLVDVNRAPDDPTLALARAEGRVVPGNAGLAPAQVAARVARWHAPYHAAVDAEVARAVALHGEDAVTVVSVHSFTGEWPGQDRDFDVGVLFDRHEDLARRVLEALRAHGLRARLNEPYSGLAGLIYSAKRHGEARGVRYVELELNQHVLEAEPARTRVARAVEGALRTALPQGRPR
ncbi:MAG: N-formylglutamate amidohydrolase [Planctomycetes bacterium]|nr:N-formylglutamate amidohydrolase [Planctomycetota bacterium]